MEKLESTLREKLSAETATYSDAEVDWLLANIGHENPEIRDDLVFVTFCKGIGEERFTLAQFQKLAQASAEHDLIMYQLPAGLPAVLTRTFAALLNALLIAADGRSESIFYHQLTAVQRDYFFAAAPTYLQKETYFTGYLEPFGWIHGFAHGADFLNEALAHPDAPKDYGQTVLAVLQQVFQRLTQPFIECEDRRLARIVCTGLRADKISQSQLATWLEQLNLLENSHADSYRLATFEVFLTYIYFHALLDCQLEPALKSAVLAYLKNI